MLRSLCLYICAILLMLPSVFAQESGTAEGTLTINGNATPLRHAYASEKPSPSEKGKRVIYVVLSDVPISAADLDDDFGLMRLGRDSKVHAVEIRINMLRKAESGSFYDSAFEGASVSTSGMHNFDWDVFNKDTISGKLWMEEPGEIDGTTYHYTATFKAAVRPEPQPTAVGAEAEKSGPGRAALAFIEAARTGNKEAIKPTVSEEMYQDLEGPMGPEILEMLPQMFPPGMKLTAVYESGDKATIEAEMKEKDGTSTIKMKAARVNGEWKMTK